MSAVCAASLGELRRELGVVCASIVIVRAKRKAAEAAERRRRLAAQACFGWGPGAARPKQRLR